MEFEWDAIKAEHNILKHGVVFEYAARVFFDPDRIDREDGRRDYSEERRVTFGRIEGRVFAVAYARRGKVLRLISARKANPREQRQYDKALST